MDQFAAVALAHFLALLIPGVDFFLIARTAMSSGSRVATGVCVGVAAANGVFIALAFSGIALIANPVLLSVIQLAGGCFLIVTGVAFLRTAGTGALGVDAAAGRTTWLGALGLGFASGILNPKNALFYLRAYHSPRSRACAGRVEESDVSGAG